MTDSFHVSVALCTHNGAEFVELQVRSILDQTVVPAEIIVSDDASTDGTVAIIEKTVAAWRRETHQHPLTLRVLRNAEPLGVTANFEQALRACSFELIALSDQDDVWHPQKIEKMLPAFVARNALLLVGTDARIVDGSGRPMGSSLFQTLSISGDEMSEVRGDRAIDALLRRNLVTGATAVVQRALVERAVPFPAAWVHDEWLAIVAAMTGEMTLLDESLIDYRQHGGNQIGAESLGFRAKIGRLSAPRTARNARLLARAEALDSRMRSIEPRPSVAHLAAVGEKLDHERMRSGLPAARLRRVAPIWRAWRSGSYARFGLGAQDVLRDLIQPV